MHLFEAAAHLCRADDSPAHRAFLQQIMDSVQRYFFDAQRGAILELPLTSTENRIEPGHQFEWYFLIHHNAQFLDHSESALALADAIFAQANLRGIDATSMRVPLSLNTNFSVKDGSFRIWTQLEWMRALAVRAQLAPRSSTDTLEKAIAAFCKHFMVADGWNEWLGGEGTADTLLRADLPASTPYHLIGCWESIKGASRP
jgi:mannose-6-phosphate isomerase